MARRFATDIDLLNFKLLHAIIDPVSTDPTLGAGDAGRVWFRSDTTPPSLRFWTGTAAIDLKDRSSATGSQTASTISDFVTAVQAIKWESLAVPTSAVPMNVQNFSGLATASGSGQAVEFAQFQTALAGVQSGLDFKSPPATVVATANISLSAPGATISGHTMVTGDTVLLTGQTTGSQNGIYTWTSASATMSRRTDSNSAGSIYSGTMISVSAADGTNPDTVWMQTAVGTGTNGAITLGTDTLTWVKPFSSTTYTGSSTISVSAGIISAILATGSGLLSSSGLAIDPSVVAQKKNTVVPTATAGAWTIATNVGTYNHGLGNYGPEVTIRAYTTPATGFTAGQLVEMDVVASDANNVVITFPTGSLTASAWIVQVVG